MPEQAPWMGSCASRKEGAGKGLSCGLRAKVLIVLAAERRKGSRAIHAHFSQRPLKAPQIAGPPGTRPPQAGAVEIHQPNGIIVSYKNIVGVEVGVMHASLMEAGERCPNAGHKRRRVGARAERLRQCLGVRNPFGDEIGRVIQAGNTKARGDRLWRGQARCVQPGEHPELRKASRAPLAGIKIAIPAQQRGLAAAQIMTQEPFPARAHARPASASSRRRLPLAPPPPVPGLEPRRFSRMSGLSIV